MREEEDEERSELFGGVEKVILSDGVEGRMGAAKEGKQGSTHLFEMRREEDIWVCFRRG
jgi:hypothetical protein